MADIAQNILQSIDNIVSQRLGNVSFDRTLVCTILETYDDRPGIYWVSDGSTKFEAIALDEKTYKKNTRVYVTVPQGDFNKQKIIVGAYTAETAPKYLYTNPMDYLVGAQEKVVDIEKLPQDIIWNYNFSAFGQYDTLGLEMTFETSYTDLSSEFLLKFQFNKNKNQVLIVSSKDLYGIPNNLIPNFKFNQLLTIPKEYIIDGENIITVSFENNTNGNASLNSLSLFLGYNKIEELTGEVVQVFKEDNVKLFPSNITPEEGIYYYSTNDSVTPVLNLEWFHAETDKIYSTNLTAAANYYAYWCIQEYGYTKQNNGLDIEQSGVNWKTIEKVPLNKVSGFSFTTNNLPSGGEVKYKVLIVNEDTLGTDEEEYYVSNVLALTNKDSQIDSSIFVETLSLSVNNIYHNVYGSDGQLLDNTQKYEVKVFWPDGGTFLKDNSIRISTDESSLITFKKIENEETDEEKISYVSTIDKEITQENASTLFFEYYLKENYNPTSVNIIKVEYGTGEGENFTSSNYGTIQLYAGFYNNKFSGYSFNLKCDNPVVYNIENSQTEITPIIISPTGEEIAINWNNIKCSWVNTAYGPDSEGMTRRYNLFNVSTDTKNNKIIVSLAQQANMDTVTNYHILKVIYESFEVPSSNNPETSSIKINLVAYLPIGWASSNYTEYKFQGTSMVTYDSNQTNPKFLETPYTCSHSEAENKKPNGINIRTEEKVNDFSIESDNYLLSPPALGPSALSKYTVCYYDTVDLSNCFYQQPLYISTNLYEYDYLALWDGALDINAEKNHISSASMFVGEKVRDTETSPTLLSGVLLGSIENLKSDVSSDRETGLYGFEKGLERFKLGVDGSFFVGDNNNNYISFNERNARSENNQLFIKTNKFTLDAGNLYLTSNPGNDNIIFKFSDKIKFKKDGSATIGGWEIKDGCLETVQSNVGRIRINSSSSDRSDNWIEVTNSNWQESSIPFKVARNGKLFARGADIEGNIQINGGSISINSGGTTSFSVNNEGYLYAKGAYIEGSGTFTGTIYANSLVLKEGIQIGNQHISSVDWGKIKAGTRQSSTVTESIILKYDDYNSFQMTSSYLIIKSGNKSIYNQIQIDGEKVIGSKYTVNWNGSYKSTGSIDMKWEDLGRIQIGTTIDNGGNTRISIQPSPSSLSGISYNGINIGGNHNDLLGTWYYKGSPINSSDYRLKNSIQSFNNKYEILFDKLIPILYKYNDGQSNRFHSGFIAQDMAAAVESSELTLQDFAAVCHRDPSNPESYWGIRYEEIVSLNTWQIQKAKARITELENKIAELETLIK